MPAVIVRVSLSAAVVEEYYKGIKKQVYAKSSDGRNILLPINIFHRFISKSGLNGLYEVHFDRTGKFQRVDIIS